MYALNLPTFEYKLKKADGKVLIFDVIRKKFVVLTPEEWVRQHFVNYLIQHLQYPKSLIKIEGGLTFNQMQKRSDIVVFDRSAKPWMVIECKAPTLILSEETLHQAAVYNSKLKAMYLTITNGMTSLCSLTDWIENRTILLEEMPTFPL
jgi:hypothetical protein